MSDRHNWNAPAAVWEGAPVCQSVHGVGRWCSFEKANIRFKDKFPNKT